MALVRFLLLLSLVVWLGGIIFFAFVLAPTVFAVLPTHHLAGLVVNRSLSLLHWIGLFSGAAYLVCSAILSRLNGGPALPLVRHALVVLMMVLVLISQFGLTARMNRLRADMGVIDNIARDDPRRLAFNRLHGWSTGAEGAILGLGLAVLFLTTRRLA
jgi:uncharacterized membrane protein